MCTSPARSRTRHWYKDAVIYQLHVKAFADSNNDGIGDFAGLTERLDYLQDLGVTHAVAAAVLSEPRPRRRLRHRRLPPHQPRLRHAARLPPLHARGAASAACASSPSSSSTTRRTSIPGSSARAQPADHRRAQLVRLERHRPELLRHAHHLQRHREIELDVGSGGRRLLLAPLLLAPAGPELRQSARVSGPSIQVMQRWLDIGVDGFRLDAIPYLLRARRHQQREPAGDARGHQAASARELDAYAPGKLLLAEANQWPEDVSGLFRRRRRMPHGLSLPADAAHLHGDRPGRPLPDRRHPAPDAGHSRRTASGRCSCATTTS